MRDGRRRRCWRASSARSGGRSRLRCPRCGRAPLFRGWFRMNAVCAVCDLRFERAQGYWVGAIYVNYAATTVASRSAGFFLLRTLTGPRHRRPAGAVGAVRDRLPAVVLPLQPQPLAGPGVRAEPGAVRTRRAEAAGARSRHWPCWPRRPAAYEVVAVADGGVAEPGSVRFTGHAAQAGAARREQEPRRVRRPQGRPRRSCSGPTAGVRGSVILVEGVARGKKPGAEMRARQQQVRVRRPRLRRHGRASEPA